MLPGVMLESVEKKVAVVFDMETVVLHEKKVGDDWVAVAVNELK
jgi:hypothetical protein